VGRDALVLACPWSVREAEATMTIERAIVIGILVVILFYVLEHLH